jgi:hypothetical protein
MWQVGEDLKEIERMDKRWWKLTDKAIWVSLSAGLCLAVILTAGLVAAEHSYDSPYSGDPPQNAQERADLLKAIQKLDEKPEGEWDEADLYQALQNPYAFKDPQAALEMADTYKAIQKLNSIYYGPHGGESWYYWASMWLNGPNEGAAPNTAKGYSAMENPYAYRDPQASLELASAKKAIQKLNSLQYGPHSEDSWHYWADIWLN